MPVCSECGAALPDGSRSCSVCGTRLTRYGVNIKKINRNEIPVPRKTIAYLLVFAIVVVSVSLYVISKLTSGTEEKPSQIGTEYIYASAGGTIVYERIQIAIPAGALFKDSTISVAKSTALPPPGYRIIGDVYNAQPSGTRFRKPVTVTLSYADKDIPAGVREAEITMGVREAEITMEGPSRGWVKLESAVDTVKNTVTASVNSFTQFAILGLEDESMLAVTVSPNVVIVNRTTEVSVYVKTYTGLPVENATVTISSKIVMHPDIPATSVSSTTTYGMARLSVKPTINDLYGLTVKAVKTGYKDGFTELVAVIDLSYKDLCADWDKDLKRFRTFVSGETVNIKDTVVEVTFYNNAKLAGKTVTLTVLKMDSIVNTIYENDLIAFIGDYRLEYKIGDAVCIPLHIKQYEVEGEVIILAEEQYNYKYAEIPTGAVPTVIFTQTETFPDTRSASVGLRLEKAQEVSNFKVVLYEADTVIDSQDPLTLVAGPHIAFVDANKDGKVSTGDFFAISNLKTDIRYTFRLYHRQTGVLLDATSWLL